MHQKMDKREFYVAIISILFVTCVYAYAFYTIHVSPPVHEVVIYRVFEVTHPKNARLEATDVYTYGQGIYSFYGYHEFEVGKSYHVKYIERRIANAEMLELLYMVEVKMIE